MTTRFLTCFGRIGRDWGFGNRAAGCALPPNLLLLMLVVLSMLGYKQAAQGTALPGIPATVTAAKIHLFLPPVPQNPETTWVWVYKGTW